MIGYVMLGTNDCDRANAFYDQLFAVTGGKRLMEFPGCVVWGTSHAAPQLAATKPYDGNPASVGNGTMVALTAKTRADVDAMYAKAIELGGKDEGPAGLRGEEGPNAFYAGYFRDLDGNKLCVFRVGPA
jgi:predicted enzyme related to lactoylglutathione lyase